MIVKDHIFFPLEPQSAIRTVKAQTYLTAISEDAAQAIQDSFTHLFDKLGKEYWSKVDRNGKETIRRSKPDHVKTKKYLDKNLAYKKELQFLANKVDYKLPEDSFFMWFLMPMPRSWTNKKKRAMTFKLHKNKRDTDNLTKLIFDSLAPRKHRFSDVKDDRVISSFGCAKLYVPDGIDCGTLIIHYELKEFLDLFFKDAIKLMNFDILDISTQNYIL